MRERARGAREYPLAQASCSTPKMRRAAVQSHWRGTLIRKPTVHTVCRYRGSKMRRAAVQSHWRGTLIRKPTVHTVCRYRGSVSLPAGSAQDWAGLREDFDRDGFCVVPDVLPKQLLASIEAFSTREAEAMTDDEKEQHKFTGSLIPTVDPVFQPLLTNKTVLAVLEQLGFGSNVKWSCGFIISKPPGGPSLAWHQDCACWDDDVAYQRTPHQIFAMYYLTDTSPDNGCLRVLPGSHLKKHPMHDVLAGIAAHSDESRQKDSSGPEHDDNVAGAVDVCVKAGDVVFGDNRVLHGARQNASDERRTVITIWYHPHYDELPERVTKGVVPPAHQAFASPIYHIWSQEQLADAKAILPDMHDYPLALENGMDSSDHSLDSFDRSPRLERMLT
eukprot:SAG31_NODE_2182_length_6246_cov_3.051407_1_plen_389_part_00